ncbi:DUF397 domain-containing protein [Streptomyces sp. N35]|uniref:DUF397 domain-containing protein n=1 Tax=Streptomyces sp. N35 TaxID=2795730 RepID=UPI0027DDD3B4|nr:DUF397 domain-containing protein [Streptomyces sp. N35]
MPTHHWQKSSYCGEGEACLHVAEAPNGILLTESANPQETIVSTTPAAFATLLTAIKRNVIAPTPGSKSPTVTTIWSSCSRH